MQLVESLSRLRRTGQSTVRTADAMAMLNVNRSHASHVLSRLARREKALVDFLYLAPARSGLFAALPEIEIPRGFSLPKARQMASRIQSPQRRIYVLDRLKKITAPRHA